jgi:hypothetical protein
MEVGSVASSAGVQVQMLKKAQESQIQLAEKLIATSVEMQIDSEKMEIAGEIIDVYA